MLLISPIIVGFHFDQHCRYRDSWSTYDKTVNKDWHFAKTTVPVLKVTLNPSNEHWFNSLNGNASQGGNHPIVLWLSKCKRIVLVNKQGNAPVCYHRPGSDIGNLWYASLGVLNTGGRVSSSASLAGVNGKRSVDDHWFTFNSNGLFSGEASVVFKFEDDSSVSFKLQDCINGGSVKTFTS